MDSITTLRYSRTSKPKIGKRADLGDKFFRSAWEANWARYLEWQKKNGHITSWSYESEKFIFENIRSGCTSYTPDFTVTMPNGVVIRQEIKGWMDPKSETKLKRMKRLYPAIVIDLVDGKRYRAVAKKMRCIIDGWE